LSEELSHACMSLGNLTNSQKGSPTTLRSMPRWAHRHPRRHSPPARDEVRSTRQTNFEGAAACRCETMALNPSCRQLPDRNWCAAPPRLHPKILRAEFTWGLCASPYFPELVARVAASGLSRRHGAPLAPGSSGCRPMPELPPKFPSFARYLELEYQ